VAYNHLATRNKLGGLILPGYAISWNTRISRRLRLRTLDGAVEARTTDELGTL
jgi:hypothetical protein